MPIKVEPRDDGHEVEEVTHLEGWLKNTKRNSSKQTVSKLILVTSVSNTEPP